MTRGKIIVALLLFVLFSHQLPYAWALTSGPRDPNTVVTEGSGLAWNNPNNAKASDNLWAVAFGYDGQTSQRLRATNFGFNIPLGFQITGIKVEIERSLYPGALAVIKDVEVKIVKSDGSVGTENKAALATVWPDADAYRTYGGEGALWSETWSTSDINDPDFGVVISAELVFTGTGGAEARIDHVRITIYYSVAVGGVIVPLNTLSVLAPYLAMIGLVAVATTAAIVVKKRRN